MGGEGNELILENMLHLCAVCVDPSNKSYKEASIYTTESKMKCLLKK